MCVGEDRCVWGRVELDGRDASLCHSVLQHMKPSPCMARALHCEGDQRAGFCGGGGHVSNVAT